MSNLPRKLRDLADFREPNDLPTSVIACIDTAEIERLVEQRDALAASVADWLAYLDDAEAGNIDDETRLLKAMRAAMEPKP